MAQPQSPPSAADSVFLVLEALRLANAIVLAVRDILAAEGLEPDAVLSAPWPLAVRLTDEVAQHLAATPKQTLDAIAEMRLPNIEKGHQYG